MPAKSKKQKKFMQAVANNPEFAKKVGVKQSVGKEFTKEKDMKKVKKMQMGGRAMADKAGAQAMDPRMKMAMEAQRQQAAMGGMRKGGMVKKYDDGGKVDNEVVNNSNTTYTNNKPEGVKGRTSKKAKEDQLQYARGYRRGLIESKKNFNARGDAKDEGTLGKIGEKLNTIMSSDKNTSGYKKGVEDMDKALKGQGAFKKGGNVKKYKEMAERDKPAVKRMLEEKPKRPPKPPQARALDMVASPGEAMARAVEGTRRAMEKAGLSPVRGTMPPAGMKKGGNVKKYKKGGSIDGCAVRGHTRAKHR
jgi:hypothetical protein